MITPHWNPYTASLGKLVVFVTVLVSHAFVVSGLIQMERQELQPADVSMQLVFIQSVKKTTRSSAKVTLKRVDAVKSVPTPVLRSPAVAVNHPSNSALSIKTTTLDDVWTYPVSAKNDVIESQQNPFIDRSGPFLPQTRNHLQLRQSVSPEAVVKRVSKLLGFWPRGYSDSPCDGLDKAVQMFSQGSSQRERRLLDDALDQRNRYCM